MQQKRLQNIVTTSSFLLPVAAVLCALIWIYANPTYELTHWIGLVFCTICTAFMVELNNTNMLIRVRTRMVGTTLLVLWTSCGFLHPFQTAHFAILCLLICYHALMYIYQQNHNTGTTFFIYACIGGISMIIQPLCILALAFFFVLGYFRALSFKSFLAGLIGFFLPFWLVFSSCFLIDKTDLIIQYVSDYSQWIPFQYHTVNSHHVAAFTLLLLIVIPSVMHFIRNNFQDKIKVRMFFYFILWMELVLTLGIIVLPHHFQEFYLLLIMNSSPLIAHFLTLSNNKFSNYFFITIVMLIAALTIYTLWMPSFNFF